MKTFMQWLEGLQHRLNGPAQVFTQSSPTQVQQLKTWKSDPAQAYKNPQQAKEMEQKARGRAELINRKYNNKVRMYKTIIQQNLEQRIYNITNSVNQISVSIAEKEKSKGVWNTNLNISGTGRIEYYYAKDVSTNIVDPDQQSIEAVPLTPLNKTLSHYDEAVVIGKNIKWDTLYYAPEIEQQVPNLAQIAQKFNLKLVSTDESGLPAPITYTQGLEKTNKLNLNT